MTKLDRRKERWIEKVFMKRIIMSLVKHDKLNDVNMNLISTSQPSALNKLYFLSRGMVILVSLSFFILFEGNT